MSHRRHGDPLPLGDAELPYSKGLMARALIAVGVTADRAYSLARRIEVDLAERRERTVDLARLEELARETLGDKEGDRAVKRLRRLADLQALDVPLIVLIGGSTGTGKSTIAAEVAHRLGITRVTSTDFIRQTMRAFFSEEFMPTIHRSSFPTEVEGVLVVHVIVAIPDEEAHRMHFHIRDATTGGIRAMDKYLDHLDAIRTVQAHLVERAIREGVPVVENANVERAIDEVVEHVLLAADRARLPA